MLEINYLTIFKKDLKRMAKRGKDMQKLLEIIETIRKRKPLEIKHRNHKLKGNYTGLWECHIEPDWLFIYEIETNIFILPSHRKPF